MTTIDLATLSNIIMVGLGSFAVWTLVQIHKDFRECLAKVARHSEILAAHEVIIRQLELKMSSLEERIKDLGEFLRDQGFRMREDVRKAREER